jgi:hypothetical protein
MRSRTLLPLLASLGLLLATAPPTGAATLAHWWKGNGDFVDTIAANNGAAVGNTTFATGHDGQAFSFDGNDDYVSVPDDPSHYFSGSFALDAWVKTSDTTGVQTIAAKYECANFCPSFSALTVYEIYVADGQAGGEIRDADGGAAQSDGGQAIGGGPQIADGSFHHVALIRDNEAAKLALYVDGIEVSEEDLDPGAAGAFANTDAEADPFTIGGIIEGGTNVPFQETTGLVDDVRLWSGAEYPDKSPPTVAPVVTGTLGDNGFYRGDVSLGWSVQDPESVVRTTSGCGQASVGETGGTTFTCQAGTAGGSASQSVTIKRDATPPAVTCAAPAPSFTLGESPASVSASVSDETSGPAATSVSTPADTSSAGSKTAAVAASDLAGNSTTVNCPYKVKANADVAAAASTPACLSIPAVTRNQVAPVKGGGRVSLGTSQVDDPAAPMKATLKFTGSGSVRSIAYTLNGKILAASGPSASVPIGALKLGGSGNRLVAKVTLRDGRKVTVTQRFVVLRCPLPRVSCKRQADGRSLRCSARTPLGARRVKVTVTRSAAETAKGSATVAGGRYTVTVRSSAPLGAGRYAYKHVATTSRRGQKFQMIRIVEVA